MGERGISDVTPVFRAVRPGWLDAGCLTYRAFLLREGEGGLSVSEIRANAESALKNSRGSARLVSGAVRELGLGVVPMEHDADPGYAWITGLPRYAEEGDAGRQMANDAADELLKIAAYPA